MDKTLFYAREKLLAQDLNAVVTDTEAYGQDTISKLLLGSDTIISGFVCTGNAPADNIVNITAGLGYHSDGRKIEATSTTLTWDGTDADAPHLTEPRIDVICVRHQYANTGATTRYFIDTNPSSPTYGQQLPSVVITEQDDSFGFYVAMGTHSATPVIPTPPSGYVPLCLVYIHSQAENNAHGIPDPTKAVIHNSGAGWSYAGGWKPNYLSDFDALYYNSQNADTLLEIENKEFLIPIDENVGPGVARASVNITPTVSMGYLFLTDIVDVLSNVDGGATGPFKNQPVYGPDGTSSAIQANFIFGKISDLTYGNETVTFYMGDPQGVYVPSNCNVDVTLTYPLHVCLKNLPSNVFRNEFQTGITIDMNLEHRIEDLENGTTLNPLYLRRDGGNTMDNAIQFNAGLAVPPFIVPVGATGTVTNLNADLHDNLHIGQTPASDFIPYVDGSSRMAIGTSPSVGITGIQLAADGDCRMQLQGRTVSSNKLFIGYYGNNTSATHYGALQVDSGAVNLISGHSGSTYKPLTFWNTGVERMRLETNGNFCIGTTTSTYKLNVNGVINASEFRSDPGGVNPTIFRANQTEISLANTFLMWGTTINSTSITSLYGGVTTTINFNGVTCTNQIVGGSSYPSSQGVIGRSSGNSGVYGVTTGAGSAGVYGTASDGHGVYGIGTTTGVRGWSTADFGIGVYGLGGSTGASWGGYFSGNYAGIEVDVATPTTSYAAIFNAGILIECDTTMGIRGHKVLGGGSSLGVSWLDTGGDNYLLYRVVSSRKYKENEKALNITTDQILKLAPISFDWKKGTALNLKDNEDFGLIAEDVEKIIPKLVNYTFEGEPQSVRYDMLSVLLLKVVKEQQDDIKKLTARMEALENHG